MLFRCLTVAAFAVLSFAPSLPPLSKIQALAAAFTLLLVFAFLGASAQQRVFLAKIALPVVGLLWAMLWGALQLQDRLPRDDEAKDILIQAVVVSAQFRETNSQQLEVVVAAAVDHEGRAVVGIPERLRLSYRARKAFNHRQLSGRADKQTGLIETLVADDSHFFREGEGWEFWVRLKRPRGFANLGGFDYERWLLARGIGATGYVKTGKEYAPERLTELDHPLHFWIGEIKRGLSENYGEGAAAATLSALAFGDRSGLSREDNQLLQRSGLSHLLAISGLHVGLAAVFGAWLGRYLGFVLVWWRPLIFHGPVIGLWVGVCFAIAYAAIAGFSLATQRALVMLLVGALWLSLYRRYSPWLAWWWSMLAVLVLQPLSLLEPGFWFSFTAVAVLMLLLTGRFDGWVQRLLFVVKAQCLLFVCLTCLQWFLGSSVSALSPAANLLAIPYVSFVVVPQVLLALIASVFSWEVAQLFWSGAHYALTFFWWVMNGGQSWFEGSVLPLPPSLSTIALGSSGLWGQIWSIVILALIPLALLLVILPFTFALRALAMMVLVSILMAVRESDESAQFYVLDVGQGLSIVASSEGQTLVYDTGPEYSPKFNAGESVVLPFLTARRHRQIDLATISHWDSDHIGGFAAVAEAVEVRRWLVSEPSSSQALSLNRSLDDCAMDREYRIGEWRIRVLGYQSKGYQRKAYRDKSHAEEGEREVYRKRNNRSCVLLMDLDGFRVLLPGDVERLREMRLLAHPLLQTPVDVMIAPHHGSGTSSSRSWVRQLSPKQVVYSSGYRNRYGHPQAGVQQRYRQVGSTALLTSRDGGLHFQRDQKGVWAVQGHRHRHRRYWR